MRFLLIIFLFSSKIVLAQTGADTIRTDSGLKYVLLDTGKGAYPVKGDKVFITYTGTFKDGRIFDTSALDRGPIKLTLGRGDFIPAWEEILPKMQVGTRLILVVPAHLGYGSRGLESDDIAGEYMVPPNEDLVFEMELVKIKK